MLFNFSFEDFQRILNENQGRPVYEVTDSGFVLYWTLNGFIYKTSLSFNEMLESYRKDIGDNSATLEKAICVFKENYLKDCFQHRGKLSKQSIKISANIPPEVRVESKVDSKWAFKKVAGTKDIEPDTAWMEDVPDTGNKVIKGLNNNSAVTIVGILEKSKEEEQRIFKQKPIVAHNDEVIRNRVDETPPDASGIKPKVEVRTDSVLLGKMLPAKKVVE